MYSRGLLAVFARTWTREVRSGDLRCVTGDPPAGLPGVPRSRAS